MSTSGITPPEPSEDINDLPAPPMFPGVNKFILGAPVQPLERLATFSDKQFEIFVWEWAADYLGHKYNQVQRRGCAGDKGRDVIAWIDAHGTKPRHWDNYQCKHYKDPLTPSDVCIELGKMCFYTHRGDYTVPDHYYFVTHKGIGDKLQRMLDDASQLQNEVITTWDTRCKDKITNAPVTLEQGLLNYVRSFDFSIVQAVLPEQLLQEHSQTRYHALIFGTFVRSRPAAPQPPATIQQQETRYIQQLYEAFSDHLKKPVQKALDFQDRRDMTRDFGRARIGFYSVESLMEFARDNLPDDSYFHDLKSQFESGLGIVVDDEGHADGYVRMKETCKMALSLQIDASVLKEQLRTDDRIGMCQHLANDDRLTWVPK